MFFNQPMCNNMLINGSDSNWFVSVEIISKSSHEKNEDLSSISTSEIAQMTVQKGLIMGGQTTVQSYSGT